MQSKIQEFLEKNYPNLYLATEVAEATQVSRESARRQLKKLVAKGAVMVKDGRYGSAPREGPKKAGGLQQRIESLSGLTGIPEAVIGDWVEGVKAKGMFSGEEDKEQ